MLFSVKTNATNKHRVTHITDITNTRRTVVTEITQTNHTAASDKLR